MNGLAGCVKEVAIRRINDSTQSEEIDFLAAEEPLEIRLEGKSIAVVMRTPGDDRELAAGFLVSEGLVRHASEITAIERCAHCLGRSWLQQSKNAEASHVGAGASVANIVSVRLRNPATLDLAKLTRHVFTSSSCGICSKASIDAVRQQFPAIDDPCHLDLQVLLSLPQALTVAQETFQRTGGLHACALFDVAGKLIVLREDVGRHNALDKVIGWALLEGRLPARECVLLLSGRTSFEMLQKALAAGIPIIAGISAPSSLAVMFARESCQTLIGFLRGTRMNIYAGADRIRARAVGLPNMRR